MRRGQRSVPEPGQHDCGGFAQTGGDVDEARFAGRATGKQLRLGIARISLAVREATLVVIRLVSGRRAEKTS